MTVPVLADEHVRRVFVAKLRAKGFDVAWIDGGYEAGTPDVEHLERSGATGRVIVTNDVDFIRLHESYDHAGIVVYADQNVSIGGVRSRCKADRTLRSTGGSSGASRLAGRVD